MQPSCTRKPATCTNWLSNVNSANPRDGFLCKLTEYVKKGSQAGDAFIEAAKLFQRADGAKFDGSRAYENAAKCYKRHDPAGAVAALKEAIVLDEEGGNFRQAARHYQEVAELYEGELDNLKAAYDAYDHAAQLFSADDSPAQVSRKLLSLCKTYTLHVAWQTNAS